MNGSSTRRQFLRQAAGAGLGLTAASYARAVGANERISIGVIGCGSRGVGAHMAGVHRHAKAANLEITAVADPWRVPRERAAAKAKEWYGRAARQFVSYRDLVALKDVDAVMIASCDHQHTAHLEAAAKAGKDVYCEKPLGKDFDKLKAACEAVRAAKIVFQAGTQLRSIPTMGGCRELYKTGILGTVSRIEQRRNSTRPYWYGYLKDAKKRDVDWDEFLSGLPDRPFSAEQYTGWYGYRDFSDGPVPGLASHFIDLVHYITGAKFPTSAVCLGGTYTWKDEHKFTCPDHVQALWEYPEGFLVAYSTNFGNSHDSSFKLLGDQGTIDIAHWNLAHLTAEGGSKNKGVIRGKKPVKEIPHADHFLDWLQCIRSRETPNADIEAGWQHGVAVIMAMRAYDTGRRYVYDADKSEIRPG